VGSNESYRAVLSCGAVFFTLYNIILTFESVDEILKCDIRVKAFEQYFPVVLFIML